MAKAKKGDRVIINYIGRIDDETVFDSTFEDEHCADDCGDDCGCGTGPRELTIGQEELFPQIDEALVGMAPGEKKTITIPMEDAFGEYDQDKVFTVSRANLPEDFHAEVGDELVLANEEEEEFGVLVVDMGEGTVTFDANHPLAGSDLIYELELVRIL